MSNFSNLRPVYLEQAFRSPIGKFGGSLKSLTAAKLAAHTLQECLKKSEDHSPPVDKVIMGHARQAGCGPNPARQATLFSGLSESIPAWTVNQACASGMSAVAQGFDRIRFHQDNCLYSGGVESMSNTPYLLEKARWGHKMGSQKIIDGMYRDGFHCPMADMLMGETVEKYIAQAQKISRTEQDEFALQSQLRASESQNKGLFNNEILKVENILEEDEHIRHGVNLEKLAKLPSVFASDGSVTAGNASGITDGAAWLRLNSNKDFSMGIEIVDYAMTALNPGEMGLGPISSIQELLRNNDLQVSDIDFFEINEAFAAQAIACKNALNIPSEKLNSRGGAIALGHPIGATGARILVTLAHTLLQEGKANDIGIASLCVSGGMGYSILIKKHA